ncbi:MAG: YbhN family protein [Halobacteriaceae archaeon]
MPFAGGQSTIEPMEIDWRSAILGFAGALLVLAGLVWVVGAGNVWTAIIALRLRDVALIGALSLTWLASWGLVLKTVLDAVEVDAGAAESVLLFSGATFANNVTPFGQAGGEPISAYLISRSTGTPYERGLAAIASVDALNFVPSIGVALAGLAYYVTVVTVGDELLFVLGVVVGLAVAVPLVVYLGWRGRRRVRETVVRTLGPVLNVVGRLLPGVSTPGPGTVRRRVDSFFGSLGLVADSRRDLAVALGFSLLGWSLMAAMLWLSLAVLGQQVPVAAVFVAVPVATIASVTPLPGGLGGVETALVLLIVPATSVPPAVASAAALVYRGATYWLPTLVGGVALAWLEARPG